MIVAAVLLAGSLSAASLLADGHRRGGRHFDDDERHIRSSPGKGNEGNETTGQVAAWLLAAVNLTVALSVLIKWTIRFTSPGSGFKKGLMQFNRRQKKLLMPLHYWLNPLILTIVLWHWLMSRCKSTALPEWGLLMMVVLMGLGILLKFKWGPKSLRKGAYHIHTQPFILIALITVLTIGHLIVD